MVLLWLLRFFEVHMPYFCVCVCFLHIVNIYVEIECLVMDLVDSNLMCDLYCMDVYVAKILFDSCSVIIVAGT